MNVYRIAADFNLKPTFETPNDVVWMGVFSEPLGHLLTSHNIFFTTTLQDNRDNPNYGEYMVRFVYPKKSEMETVSIQRKG